MRKTHKHGRKLTPEQLQAKNEQRIVRILQNPNHPLYNTVHRMTLANIIDQNGRPVDQIAAKN